MNSKWDKYSIEEFINIMDNEFKQIGSYSYDKYRKEKSDDSPSIKSCFRKLQVKTWNEFISKLGYEPNQYYSPNYISNEELLNIIKELTIKLGHIPSTNEIKKNGYNRNIYTKKFGKYENALKLLDNDLKKKYSRRKNKNKIQIL